MKDYCIIDTDIHRVSEIVNFINEVDDWRRINEINIADWKVTYGDSVDNTDYKKMTYRLFYRIEDLEHRIFFKLKW